ncbi:hypothetical protein CEXT_270261 [Caerostris extrusa]|uniref:Uncharacterized protein n=1 Tax=Caerostris extrusa TaxID=172846 RepID=A0AAV4TLD1_CAEEX|nr:hypothetical protein CEXT_270261 [Caerostris extrusa]
MVEVRYKKKKKKKNNNSNTKAGKEKEVFCCCLLECLQISSRTRSPPRFQFYRRIWEHMIDGYANGYSRPEKYREFGFVLNTNAGINIY